jgi:hypothetical protein
MCVVVISTADLPRVPPLELLAKVGDEASEGAKDEAVCLGIIELDAVGGAATIGLGLHQQSCRAHRRESHC